MLTIDGSYGEGGGQILRSSLALSLITQTPFRIEKIRARREKSGLMRQHLAAVRAAQEISGADVKGAEIGSRELTFRPGPITPGTYTFRVGTAGSSTLVFQTVLPALLHAAGPSSLFLEGGTHNSHAPPFDFLSKVYLPLVCRMGPDITATLERPGFYPAGGGRFRAEIKPVEKLGRLDLPTRGNIKERRAFVRVANLPYHIVEREIATLQEKLGWDRAAFQGEKLKDVQGPGNVILIEIESEHLTEIFSGFGVKGVPAEEVARRAADEALLYIKAGVPVGEHLADQLLLPMALAGGGSFRTTEPSLHTRTHIEVIKTFLGINTRVEQESEKVWYIEVGA